MTFDSHAFYTAVERERARRALSLRAVARETNVTVSTLSRMQHGRTPAIDAVLSLCAWAHVDVNQFAGRPS